MSLQSEIIVGPESNSTISSKASPKVKPAPTYGTGKGKFPLKFEYSASSDGVDENLLIMLHGLGDSEKPFANLGKQLKLPQTAVLSLRAPGKIPYLYEEAFQWYESFDSLGELLTSPDPTPALSIISQVLSHLIDICLWPEERIHLFGFGQGGSVVSEFALRHWREGKGRKISELNSEYSTAGKLGSVVSVEGPLLSFPTLTPPCDTPILFFHRSSSVSDVKAFKKGFSSLSDVQMPGQEGSMPKGKEWAKIVEFWSRMLGIRDIEMEGVYPVISGGPAPPTTK